MKMLPKRPESQIYEITVMNKLRFTVLCFRSFNDRSIFPCQLRKVKKQKIEGCALSKDLRHVSCGFMFCHDPTMTNTTTLDNSSTVNQQIFGFVKFQPTMTKACFSGDKFSARGRARKSVTSAVCAMTTKFQPQ